MSGTTTNNKLVLCVGICCLDVIHVCDDYPAEDSDRRSRHGRWQRGGNPSNNCTVLALMGQPCEYLGVYSADAMFQPVMEDFTRRGISIRHCVSQENVEIPLSSVVLSLSTGTRTIVHCNPNLRELTMNDFGACDLRDYRWIHFEPRSSAVPQMMQSVRDWNSQRREDQEECDRIQVSLELEKPRHPLEYAELCDVLFISQVYAEEMFHADSPTAAVTKARQAIQNKNNKIICAWGSKGAAALDNFKDTEDDVVSSVAFPPPVVVDTLGAGDTFCASVIYALLNGKWLQEALLFGNRVAGSKVGFYGYDGIAKVYKEFL